MTLKERIEEYCKYAKIRISAFERRAGLSNGYFNQVKKEPSPSKLSQIEEAFPDLNTDWMLTEKGSMLKNTDQPVSQGGEDATLSEADLNNSNTMKKCLDQVLRQNEELIRQNGVLLDLFREERAKNKGEVALKKEG